MARPGEPYPGSRGLSASGGPSVPAAPLPPPGPYTLLDIRNSPVPLKLTWARDAVYPAAICLRKDFRLLDVIKFTAKADLTLPDARLVCGFSCKDTLFHGRFSLNVPARMVEYRKKFQLPNGTGLAVSAGLQHVGGGWDWGATSLRDQFRPILAAQLDFGGLGPWGNAVLGPDGGFNLKQRLPLPHRLVSIRYPRFELETYATIKVPQLSARYSVQRDAHRSSFPGSFGELGQEPLHLHVSAANFVIRL